MNVIKRLFANIGFDGLIFGISGLGAIIFGIWDFFGYTLVEGEQLSNILIAAVGILLLAVVSLTAKRKGEIDEIREAVGVIHSELLLSPRDLEDNLAASARNAG